MSTTDYANPATVDVDEVMANIDTAYRFRGHTWTDAAIWPNVTVKALADETRRLRAENERLYKKAYLTIKVPSFLHCIVASRSGKAKPPPPPPGPGC